MRRGAMLGAALVALFSGIGTGFGPPPLGAQGPPGELSRTQFGIGYVANAPNMLGGGNAYVLFPVLGGIGVYIDAKFDLNNPSDDIAFRSDITDDEVGSKVPGAEYLKREFSWKSFNVGVVRPLTPYMMVYGGAGPARATIFRLYQTIEADIGRALWVEAPDLEETRVNVMLGVFFRLTSLISSQFGFETQPRGITAGASLRLPRW
ncbi:MAG: hypothetical protein PVJ04_14060 [Gemmatimonadota bacterium]